VNEFVTITCPHCGEDFQIPYDPDEGSAEFIVDCEVCCRPMTVSLKTKPGEVVSVDISAA